MGIVSLIQQLYIPGGPQSEFTFAGVELIEAILARGDLADYHFIHSARADLYHRLRKVEEARASYEQTLGLSGQKSEREFLERRLREL